MWLGLSCQIAGRCRGGLLEGFSFVNYGDMECRVDLLMMRGPEVFGKVVAEVFIAVLPVNKEVTLFYTVSYPVEPHVYCIGTILLDGVIRNSSSTLVVCVYGSGRLGTTKLVQDGMNGDFLFCIEEECPKF